MKCGECPNQNFVKYDAGAVEKHLKGQLTAGVYPMFPDEKHLKGQGAIEEHMNAARTSEKEKAKIQEELKSIKPRNPIPASS
jgi:hypothetical protein